MFVHLLLLVLKSKKMFQADKQAELYRKIQEILSTMFTKYRILNDDLEMLARNTNYLNYRIDEKNAHHSSRSMQVI